MKKFTRKFIGLLTIAFTLGISQLFAQTTLDFNYTGAYQEWVVPCGVTEINVVMAGAAGGAGLSTMYWGGGGSSTSSESGGNGGSVSADMTVEPGEILYFYIGGKGPDGNSSNGAGWYSGGWNGGGSGKGAGGGGGSSDIRIGGNEISDRVIVAGSGGGSKYVSFTAKPGGIGGGLEAPNVSQAYGGTQTGCATYSWGGYYGNPGSLGYGGNAFSIYGGGGGGSGWYGGSGGFSDGGAGGSSYTNPEIFTNVVHVQGSNSGNGSLSISYSLGDIGACLVDECGIPYGDNSYCTDECGILNGDNSSCLDECDVINGDNSSCSDECGVPNGDNSSCLDECDVINGDNSSCSDECGVPNGDNSSCSDECGVPNGDNSSCSDECGEINGDNSSCSDECGVPNGSGS